MDRQTASVIAAAASDAINSVDQIYRSYADYLKEKTGAVREYPPDFRYLNNPEEKAFVAASRRSGAEHQKVSYQELCEKLSGSDKHYVETLDAALSDLGTRWNATYKAWSQAEGAKRKKYQTELDELAPLIADPLIRILDFVQKMGLWLDDHYVFARQIGQAYLKAAGLEEPEFGSTS